jgi:tetratricopeptide (TPR) repeat protein
MRSALRLARRLPLSSVQSLNRAAPACSPRVQIRSASSSSYKDVTESAFTVTSASCVDLMNDSIMNYITYNGSVVTTLDDVVKIDQDCPLAHLLFIFESLRDGSSPPGHEDTMAMHYATVARLMQESRLNRREMAFAYAAFAWRQGNYYKAGAILEKALLENPYDVLAMRLAQDCYLAAGSSAQALGCVLRYPEVLEQNTHHLKGSVLGMLSAGYMERGMLNDAEDVGIKAVEYSKGGDAWALHSLLNTYQLSGRSSEALGILTEFVDKHSGSGRAMLEYNKTISLCMRGNYTGASRCLEDLIDYISFREEVDPTQTYDQRTTGKLIPIDPSAKLLCYATIAYWRINVDRPGGETPSTLGKLWHEHMTKNNIYKKNNKELGLENAMNDLCATIAFAGSMSHNLEVIVAIIIFVLVMLFMLFLLLFTVIFGCCCCFTFLRPVLFGLWRSR